MLRVSQCYRWNRYEKHTRLNVAAVMRMEAKRNKLIHDDHKFLALEFLKGDLLPSSSTLLLLYFTTASSRSVSSASQSCRGIKSMQHLWNERHTH